MSSLTRCCFPSSKASDPNSTPAIANSNKCRKTAIIVAVALIIIGTLALILLAAPVLTPAILAAVSLSTTTVALMGSFAIATGGITLLTIFACKCVRKTSRKTPPSNPTVPPNIPPNLPSPSVPLSPPSPFTPLPPQPSPSQRLSLPTLPAQEEEKKGQANVPDPFFPLNNPEIPIPILSELFGSGSPSDTLTGDPVTGVSVEETASYFLKLLTETESKEMGPSRLFGQLQQVLDNARTARTSSTPAFADGMIKKIGGMTCGDSLLIAAGWDRNSNTTILLNIEAIAEDAFEITIYNTGPGAEYHTPAANRVPGGKHPLTKKLCCSKGALLTHSFWATYHILNFSDKSFSSAHFYEIFLKTICSTDDSEKSTGERKEVAATAIASDTASSAIPQLTNCSAQVFLAFIQHKSGTDRFYFLLRALLKHLDTLDKNAVFKLSSTPSEREVRVKLIAINQVTGWVEKLALEAAAAIRNGEIKPDRGKVIDDFSNIVGYKCLQARELFIKHYPQMFMGVVESFSRNSHLPHSMHIEYLEAQEESSKTRMWSRLLPWLETLSMRNDWPPATELHLVLSEWLTCLMKKRIDDAPRNDRMLYRYMQGIYENMPSSTDPYWDNIPADRREECLIKIAQFAPVFLSCQVACPNNMLFVPMNQLYMQKALLVIHRLIEKLPKEKTLGAGDYAIDTSSFRPLTNGGVGCFIDPSAQGIIDSIANCGTAKKKDLFHFHPIIFSYESSAISPTMIPITEERFKEIDGLADGLEKSTDLEEVRVWRFLKNSDSFIKLKASTKNTDYELLIMALVDLSGTCLPQAYCSLKLQLKCTEVVSKVRPNVISSTLAPCDIVENLCLGISSGVSLYTHNNSRGKPPGTEYERYMMTLPLVKDPGIAKLIEMNHQGAIKTHNDVMLSLERPPEGSCLTADEWRALQHLCCEEDKDQQVVKTIGHFNTIIRKLFHPDLQVFFTTLMFEKDLLSNQLRDYPRFLEKLKSFAATGADTARKDGNLKVQLFFLRMEDYFESYGCDIKNRARAESEEKIEKMDLEGTTDVIQKLFELAPDPAILCKLQVGELSKSDEGRILNANLVYVELLAAYGRRKHIPEKHLPKLLRMLSFSRENFEPSDDERNPMLLENYNKFSFLFVRTFQNILNSPNGIESLSKILTEACNGEFTKWEFYFFPNIIGGRPETTSLSVGEFDVLIDLEEGSFRPQGYYYLQSLPTDLMEGGSLLSERFAHLFIKEGVRKPISNVKFDISNSIYTFIVKEKGIEEEYCYTRYGFGRRFCFKGKLRDFFREKAPNWDRYWFRNYIPPKSGWNIDLMNYSKLTPEIQHIVSNCDGWQCPGTTIIIFEHRSTGAIYIFDGGSITCADKIGEFGNLFLAKPNESFIENWYLGLDAQTQFWKDKATNKLIRISLPKYDIDFTVEGRSLVCTSRPGWELAEEFVPSLFRVHSYLVLKNAQREQRVLVPKNLIRTDGHTICSFSDPLVFSSLSLPDGLSDGMYEYRLSSGELVSDDLEAKLHLVHLYLCQRSPEHYEKAFNILEEISLIRKMGPYSKNEFLRLSFVLHTAHADKDPKACALRLKALALLADNLLKHGTKNWEATEAFKNYIRVHLNSDIKMYSASSVSARKYALTSEERSVLSVAGSFITAYEQVAAAVETKEKNSKILRSRPFLGNDVLIHFPSTKPIAFHNLRSINPLIMQLAILGNEISLGYDFLSYYAIAKEADPQQKNVLRSLLCYISPSNDYYIFVRILKDALDRPMLYPSIKEVEKIFHGASGELGKMKKLQESLPVLRKQHYSVTEEDPYEAAVETINNFENEHAKQISEFFEKCVGLLPAEASTSSTSSSSSSTSPIIPSLSLASLAPKPRTATVHVPIPSSGLFLSTPSMFPDSFPLGIPFPTTEAPKRDSKEEKSKIEEKLNADLEKIDSETQKELSKAKGNLFHPAISTESGGKEGEVKSIGLEDVYKRFADFAATTKSVLEKREVEKLEKDLRGYIKQPQAGSKDHVVNLEQLPIIKTHLEEKFKTVSDAVLDLEDDILASVNDKVDPSDLSVSLSQRGKKRRRLTIDDLIIMVLNDKMKPFTKHNRALKPDDIILLKSKIETLLVLKTHAQHIGRVWKCVTEFDPSKGSPAGTTSHLTPALLREYSQRLLTQLTAKRHFSISPMDKQHKHYFKFLVIEYQRNILLHKAQIDELEGLLERNNNIHQIPMGAGKTDVLLLILLLSRADGTRLSIGMVSPELRKLVAPRLQSSAGKIYRRTAHRVSWKRATTFEGLKAIRAHLREVIRTRGFILVTDKEMHRFELEARANRLKCSKSDKEAMEKEELFREIKSILKDLGDLVIDEIDSELSSHREVHKALGEEVEIGKSEVGRTYIGITTALYYELANQKLFYIEGLTKERHPKTVPYSPEHVKLVADLQEHLASAGLNHLENNPIFASLIKGRRKELLEYLRAKNTIALAEDLGKDPDFFEALSTIRALIHTFIPMGLEKSRRHYFGLLPKKDGSMSLIAGPYNNDSPQKGSEFAHFLEQFVYSLHTYHDIGVSYVDQKGRTVYLVKEPLAAIYERAIKERTGNPRIERLEDTKAYREFEELYGKGAPVRCLIDQSEDNLKHVSEVISKNSNLVTHFVGKYILPKVKSSKIRISSNALTLPDMFSTVKGFSGTLANQDTFSQSLKAIPKDGIEGKLVKILSEDSKDAIDIISTKESGESKIAADAPEYSKRLENKALHILRESFRQHTAGPKTDIEQYRAIIDLGNTFKDVSSLRLAEEVLKLRPELDAVFFFDGDTPKTLERNAEKTGFKAVVKGHPAHIRPEKRFTIYGLLQCTGTDIPQQATAKAFVTLSKDSTTRDFFQAISRMRLLGLGQMVSFVLTEDLNFMIQTSLNKREKPDFLDIILFTLRKQCHQQGSDNLMTVHNKMRHIIYSEYNRILDAIPVAALATEAYQKLNEHTRTIIDQALTEHHGKQNIIVPALESLTKQMEALLIPVDEWLAEFSKGISDPRLKPNRERLHKQMCELIEETIRKGLVEKNLPQIVDTKKDLQVALSVHQSHDVSLTTQVNVSLSVQQTIEAERRKRAAAGLKPDKHTDLASAIPPIVGLDEALKMRGESGSDAKTTCVPISSILQRHLRNPGTAVGKGSMDKMDKMLAELFDPSLLTTLNLVCTDLGTETSGERVLFGEFQKPIDRALIIRIATGYQLVLFDGKDCSQIKELMRNATSSSSSVEALCLYHVHAGIYHQRPGTLVDIEALKRGPGGDKLALLLVQMKFLAGEIWDYTTEEQRLLSVWLGKVNAIEVEKFFRDVVIKPASVREDYDGSVMNRVFASLKTSIPSKK